MVVATTPDDSHVWNLVGVQLKLEDRGFEVMNLGACTPAELVGEVLRDRRPPLLVVSTINGHGAISLAGLMKTLEAYQVGRWTTVVAGGLLTVDPDASADAEEELLDLGVAGVFTGADAWTRFDLFLQGFFRRLADAGPTLHPGLQPALRAN